MHFMNQICGKLDFNREYTEISCYCLKLGVCEKNRIEFEFLQSLLSPSIFKIKF